MRRWLASSCTLEVARCFLAYVSHMSHIIWMLQHLLQMWGDSFGVILHEVVSGQRPIGERATEDLRHARLNVKAKFCDVKFAWLIQAAWMQLLQQLHNVKAMPHCSVTCTMTFIMYQTSLFPVRRVPLDCPQGVVELWKACTCRDAGERPTAARVKRILMHLLRVQRPETPMQQGAVIMSQQVTPH